MTTFTCAFNTNRALTVTPVKGQNINPTGIDTVLTALKTADNGRYEQLAKNGSFKATLQTAGSDFKLILDSTTLVLNLIITRNDAAQIIGQDEVEKVSPAPPTNWALYSTLALATGVATAYYSPLYGLPLMTAGIAGLISQCISKPEQKETTTPTAPAAIAAPIITPPPAVLKPTKTQALIESFDNCWNSTTKRYEGIKFDTADFQKQVTEHNAQFKPMHNPATDYGFIEKKDLAAGTKIFVRADLHGDLKSLLENLKTLQQQGLLEANYKCKPNVQLVFLGDYEDRGTNTMQVLQVLTALRMENPGQVTLIRGNHEDLLINQYFAGNDPDFLGFLAGKENRDLLDQFYQTLPLTVYMGEQAAGPKQYTQFTHGTFELYVDPFEILNASTENAQMAIPKYTGSTQLSQRVTQLENSPSAKLQKSARRMKELWKKYKESRTDQELTIYNWGDIDSYTLFESVGNRAWKLSPEDVKHYLRVSSPTHRIKLVFRGHEHLKQHWTYNKKVVVSTMPVGMDSAGYKERFPGQADTAYILTTASKVKDWTKVAYLRDPGESTRQITQPYPIRDVTI